MGAGDRFVGEIAGVGTTSGTRLVIGRWPTSPFGPIADVMVEDAAGRRVLLAPRPEVADYIGGVYEFDDVIVTAVTATREPGRLLVTGGPLAVELTIGRRDGLGWLLRAVPRPIAISPRWATIVDPVARVVLRGVRTRGTTAGGDEFYGATDRHRVEVLRATWDGADLGALSAIDPPVRFGFSSVPRRPSIVAVTTTIRRR
jgi:hypothetical protein